ncbi:hypothetical protein ACLJYM_06440 [Rhizobium giardinii]|uniref:hypothetical protein n=1 Tax=Rhizobium giardinii TaxID=56731 RepID=UPI0039E12191
MAINDWLSQNSGALLAASAGLLGGRTGNEQAGMGLAGFGNAVAERKQKNRTLEFLKQMNPELAQAVEAGALSPLDAYKTHVQAQAPMKPDRSFQTLPDGTYGFADNNSGTFNPLGQAQKPNDQSNDYATREAAAASYGLTPGSPQYQSFVLTGKIAREDAQPLTATDKKALWSAEDEIPLIDNTLSSLEQARKLNRETFTGVTAGARGWLGTSVPGGDYLVDGKTAKATSEFNKLMSMEAIQSMAQTLKGATTDQELNRFVEILADPSTDPDIRERTIDRMMALAQRQKEIKANRINELRGGGIQAPSGQGSNTGRTKSGLTFTVEQ